MGQSKRLFNDLRSREIDLEEILEQVEQWHHTTTSNATNQEARPEELKDDITNNGWTQEEIEEWDRQSNELHNTRLNTWQFHQRPKL